MRAAAWVMVCAAAAVGCGSDCDRFQRFRNVAASECVACRAANCADASAGYSAAPLECSTEFACAARCPDRSARTCGCIEACLPTPACRASLDALIACDVRACASECQ